MKKQLVSILALIICAVFSETTVMAQGIIVYKKNGGQIKIPYTELDSIVSYSRNEIQGYEYVDLGLSVKWAKCNVGAYFPEDYGDYYAWGETTTKSDYDWDTYKWCKGTYDTMTKYCTDSYYGTVDNRTTLTSSDDVAYVKLGSNWRLPTEEEMNELEKDCTWTWTTQRGVNGMKVTGPNGNSIFLPAAGYCYNSNFEAQGHAGYYWSATLLSYSNQAGNTLYFRSDDRTAGLGWKRHMGFPIRPVTE